MDISQDGARPGAAGPAARPFEVTHREVLRIIVPMSLAFLTTPLLGITDMAVIGRLGDASALAGLVVGALVFDYAFSTFNFVRSGTTGLTAQAFGAGDAAEMRAVFWRAVVLALLIGGGLILLEPAIAALGLLAVAPDAAVARATRLYLFWRMFSAPVALLNYALLGYVLGRGQAGLGLALQIVINAANIVLAVTFGLVLGGGIAGVALGTVCGEAIGAAVGFLAVVRRFDRAHRPARARLFERAAFARMIAVNRDIMVRSFCLLSAYMLFTRLGAGLGPAMLAANGVLLNMFMIGGYFLDGVANASEQLVGRSVGARWRPAFDASVRLTIAWGLALAAGLTLLFLVTGPVIVDFMTTDETVRDAARPYIAWAAVSSLAGVLAFVMDGVFIGATWSKTMRNMMLMSTLVFASLAFLLVPRFGNHGLWFALQVFLSMRGFALLAAMPAKRRQTFAA